MPKIKKETAKLLSSVCIVGCVLIILVTCGTCCTGKTTYGPEEVYQKPDGSYGYGAKSYSSNTDRLALMVGVGIPVAVLLLIASGVFAAMGDEDGTSTASKFVPKAMLFMKCPVCGKKCSRRVAACPSCGHPISRT